MIEHIMPTHQDYLLDFKERCSHLTNLEVVKERVLKRECPWDEGAFEKNKLFRLMRRYYRKNILNGLMGDLLNLIQEIKSKEGGNLKWYQQEVQKVEDQDQAQLQFLNIFQNKKH